MCQGFTYWLSSHRRPIHPHSSPRSARPILLLPWTSSRPSPTRCFRAKMSYLYGSYCTDTPLLHGHVALLYPPQPMQLRGASGAGRPVVSGGQHHIDRSGRNATPGGERGMRDAEGSREIASNGMRKVVVAQQWPGSRLGVSAHLLHCTAGPTKILNKRCIFNR